MTTLEWIFVSGCLGVLIGLLVGRYQYRNEIKELEAWNTTALVHICEVEDEKERLASEKHEANLMYVSHLDTHVCQFVGKEEEWPEVIEL